MTPDPTNQLRDDFADALYKSWKKSHTLNDESRTMYQILADDLMPFLESYADSQVRAFGERLKQRIGVKSQVTADYTKRAMDLSIEAIDEELHEGTP